MSSDFTVRVWNTEIVAPSLQPLVKGLSDVRLPLRSSGKGRPAAVLIAFTPDPVPHVLLVQRVDSARHHAGQPAFPGGAIDAGDDSAVAAALREAQEEVGLDQNDVDTFASIPPLFIPVSDYSVECVLAQWTPRSPLATQDAEIAHAHVVSVQELAHNRVLVEHSSGYVGAGFDVRNMVVWGFTGGVLAALLDAAGWSIPQLSTRVIAAPVPPEPTMIDDEPPTWH